MSIRAYQINHNKTRAVTLYVTNNIFISILYISSLTFICIVYKKSRPNYNSSINCRQSIVVVLKSFKVLAVVFFIFMRV